MEKQHRPSIFWALLLISVGVIFLLNTMQILSGNVWDLIFKLWPLLFIIGGLDNIIQGRGWIWAVISLGLGTVFLLANFGYLEWNSLNLLLKLWPLLLVALGLDLIFQGRSALATVLGVLLAIVIMGAVAWYALANTATDRVGNTSVSQKLEGATSVDVRISDPTGRMEISAGADSGSLLEGSIDLVGNNILSQDYEVQDNHGSLDLSMQGTAWGPWMAGFDDPLWQFELSREVPVTLTAETAAGSLQLDLTGINIDELNGTVAVGSLDVVLDPQDQLQGQLSNPIGKITIHVPEGALVEITLQTAISTQNYPDGFTKIGDRLYSPNATPENAKVRLEVEQPIGLVLVVSGN